MPPLYWKNFSLPKLSKLICWEYEYRLSTNKRNDNRYNLVGYAPKKPNSYIPRTTQLTYHAGGFTITLFQLMEKWNPIKKPRICVAFVSVLFLELIQNISQSNLCLPSRPQTRIGRKGIGTIRIECKGRYIHVVHRNP